MFSTYNDNKIQRYISKKEMESSIHLCWCSEAELGELQLMNEGLEWEKKRLGKVGESN